MSITRHLLFLLAVAQVYLQTSANKNKVGWFINLLLSFCQAPRGERRGKALSGASISERSSQSPYPLPRRRWSSAPLLPVDLPLWGIPTASSEPQMRVCKWVVKQFSYLILSNHPRCEDKQPKSAPKTDTETLFIHTFRGGTYWLSRRNLLSLHRICWTIYKTIKTYILWISNSE